MNELVTQWVYLRGNRVPVSALPDGSNVKVTVKCKHGEREVRWYRRHQLCHKCVAESGAYNTSKKGRKIEWGDKISKAKSGKKFSEEHKKALIQTRLEKNAAIQGLPIEEAFFPTKGAQYKLRILTMNAIGRSFIKTSIPEQDRIIFEKLNYSIEDLKKHLEAQFQPGMTWDNYGEWHVDHVRPESWFKYVDNKDPAWIECWSLNNLQPMWASQNIRKSNKYEGPYKEPFFYVLYGQSGVGKSTLLQELESKFYILDVDKVPFKKIDSIIANNWFLEKPIILNISVHISTTIRRYLDRYRVKTFALVESIEKVKEHIESRGKRTANVEARYKRVQSIIKEFNSVSGDAAFIKNELSKLVN
jgi:guanylate kinase